MKIKFLSLTLMLFLFLNSYSKQSKVKFGKIEKTDLAMEIYEPDSSASAVILYDYGESNISYLQSTGWRLVFTRHQRIKILKKDGANYGDFMIYLHKLGGEEEELYGIKAVTYNLENGKIVKSELDKKDIHKEEVNQYNDLVTFSLPNVIQGSLIEVKYEINCKSFFRNMRPWKFQHKIPTIYSEHIVRIPEYFNFRKFSLGFEKFTTYDQTYSPASVNLIEKGRTGSYSKTVQTTVNYSTVNYQEKNYHWIAENMPAFEEEAFTSTMDNYIQQVQFELESVKFPWSTLHNYSESWESINKNLKEHENFGKVVFQNYGFLKDEVENLIQNCANDTEKLNTIFNYVQDNYKSNGIKTIYSNGIRNTYKNKNGSVADINFLLASMLNTAGINTKPVILSTRSNGIYLFPTVTGLNYVILQCDCEDKQILLDASNEYYGINQIPFQCLNFKGLIVGGNVPKWIDLLEHGSSRTQYSSDISINEDGSMSGNIKVYRMGYSAINIRKTVSSHTSTEDYKEKFAQNHAAWEIKEYDVENIENKNDMIVENLRLKINDAYVAGSDRIYLSPLIFNPESNNPFKLKERKYPVDLGYKPFEQEINSFTIPKGYVIEEMPKSIMVSLPEKSAVYTFSAKQLAENKIQIINAIDFNKSLFLPEDYQYLKEFYNRIIEKQNEKIILKKI